MLLRDWLAVLKFVLILDNSRTIWEAYDQKHIGGSGGEEYLISGGYLQF